MRKTIAILSTLATCMVANLALAQAPESTPVASEVAPEAASPPSTLGSKLVLGVDAAFQNPVSAQLRRSTDLGLGVLARAEYRVITHLNLTARVGYIYSLQKASTDAGNKVKYAVDNIPIWVGGKYFVTNSIYGAAELGLNMLNASSEISSPAENNQVEKVTTNEGKNKVGMNVGAGVLVKAIDIRAQLEVLDFGEFNKSMALLVTAGFNILP